jgi:hypothetical protein
VGDFGAERTGLGRWDDRRELDSAKGKAVVSNLDERGRRLFAVGETRSAGWGGLAAVSKRVSKGMENLAAHLDRG